MSDFERKEKILNASINASKLLREAQQLLADADAKHTAGMIGEMAEGLEEQGRLLAETMVRPVPFVPGGST